MSEVYPRTISVMKLDGHRFTIRVDLNDETHGERLFDVLERWVHSHQVSFSATDAFIFGTAYAQPRDDGDDVVEVNEDYCDPDNDVDGSQTG